MARIFFSSRIGSTSIALISFLFSLYMLKQGNPNTIPAQPQQLITRWIRLPQGLPRFRRVSLYQIKGNSYGNSTKIITPEKALALDQIYVLQRHGGRFGFRRERS
jgi:hypothetical protein